MPRFLSTSETAELVAVAYELGRLHEQEQDPKTQLSARLERDALTSFFGEAMMKESAFSARQTARLAAVENALSDKALLKVLRDADRDGGTIAVHLQHLAAQMGRKRMKSADLEVRA